MIYRSNITESDLSHIKDILISSGFFYDSEVEIAMELATENIKKGAEESGYIFTVAVDNKSLVAFTCYGKIPGTESSFDLYWIAVHESQRGKGVGKILMDMMLEDVKLNGGTNIWIETSSRPLYKPTRKFYLNYGCEKIAELPEFYGKDDSKTIFLLRV